VKLLDSKTKQLINSIRASAAEASQTKFRRSAPEGFADSTSKHGVKL
jgi:hypothetical protein